MAERHTPGRTRVHPGRRKLGLALALTVAGAGIARYRAGPSAGDADTPADERLALVLGAAIGAPVAVGDLRRFPAADAPMGPGAPEELVFTATPPGQALGDVYRTRARVGGDGSLLAASSIVNLTRTSDSDEAILDAGPGRILFVHRVHERATGASLLDFRQTVAPADTDWLVASLWALSAWQSYGTWTNPFRLDLALQTPAHSLTGALSEEGLTLQQDEHLAIAVDLKNPGGVRVEPPGAVRILAGAPPPREPLALLADALRSSAVVGSARVVALEATLFDVQDWVARLRHELFPTADDRQPVAPPVRVPTPRLTGWPPPALAIPQAEAVPGEGEWVDPLAPPGRGDVGPPERPQADLDGPPLLRTFLRVDPERPYERTWIFAFDMRRLALHFVGGTQDPRSTTGARGTGSVRAEDRGALVATFNGGFKIEHGLFGAVEGGRVIVPPAPGWATVALDASGRARLGVWDLGAEVPPEVVGLRQNLPPLVAGGVVNPQRMRNWGQLVSRLDESHTPRAALGVTSGGILVFGWASATSAELLGEALRRVGVQFALHLDMNPGHTGLELYTHEGAGRVASTGEPRALPGTAEMDFRERRWLGVDPRDFFYLTTVAREEPGRAGPQDLGVATPEGPEALVRLWRLESVRPQTVPGLAEQAAPTEDGKPPPRVLKLPGAPVFSVEMGLQGAEGWGLVVAGRVWRMPTVGALALLVDAEGVPRLGKVPEVASLAAYPEIIQGPALLSGGEVVPVEAAAVDLLKLPADAPPADGEAPALLPTVRVAVGQDTRGRLVLAAGTGTTPDGLARALLDAGARQAILLTGQGTPQTGRVRFYHLAGPTLLQSERPLGRREPADLRPRAGSSLVFTGRAPPPRARGVQTFRGEDTSEGAFQKQASGGVGEK